MSQLLSKSETNHSAAELLHERSLFSAVAHSSYYSCYQLLSHIWHYTLLKTESELKAIIDDAYRLKLKERGSHNVLINEIVKYIKLNNTDDSRVLNASIRQLKRLRTSADYKDLEFSFRQSCGAIELSDKIRSVLKKHINT